MRSTSEDSELLSFVENLPVVGSHLGQGVLQQLWWGDSSSSCPLADTEGPALL